MSNVYNPARGFFIGKASKYLQILMVMALLAYPASIKADTIPEHPQTTLPVAEATSGMDQEALAGAKMDMISLANSPLTWITAYTSDPDETSDHPLITASGNMVRDGIVADNDLPFGTQIEIPSLFGNKVFTVEDRTNQRFSGRVDIWMPNVTKAVDFGIQHVQIVVLDSSVALK